MALRRLFLTSLLLASGLGCATARNYEDPAAPVYTGGAALRREAGRTLRVVTFNLKWGKEIERAVELLSRPGPLQGADLVVLQEMDREGTERIGRALGLQYVYVPSAVHPVPRHDFGVALLSPWPLEAPRKLLLPHQNRTRKLRREFETVKTRFGDVKVKLGRLNGKVVQAAPEYESCRKLAEQKRVPLKEVYEAARTALKLRT